MVILLDEAQVLPAIKAVKILNKNYFNSCEKKSLLDDPENGLLFLQVTLKKIPPFKNFQMIKVLLPFPLTCDTSEVCLITGDLDKKDRKAEIEPDVLHYKELLKTKGVTQITEVITLRQLRTEYKPYEAKRQLLAAYDTFLADKKIAGVLPRLLGKGFFRKRKLPVQIDMEAKDLKETVKLALSKTTFYISSHGNSCTSEVARLKLTNKKIHCNIMAAVNVLAEQIPGGWDNVAGLYLKTSKSKAIPVYISYGGFNDVKIKVKREYEDIEAEELSTLPNAKVKVFRSGYVSEVKKPKKVLVNEEFKKVEHSNDVKIEVKKENEDIETKQSSMQLSTKVPCGDVKDKKTYKKKKKSCNK